MRKPKKTTLIIVAGITIFFMSLMSPNPAFTFAFLSIVVASSWMIFTRRQKLAEFFTEPDSAFPSRRPVEEDEPVYNFDTFKAAEKPRKKPHPDYENPLTDKESSDWEQIVARFRD